MAMTGLRPFLAVPYWRTGKHSGLFQLTARDVYADPATHADPGNARSWPICATR
jgi:hypothetical protein